MSKTTIKKGATVNVKTKSGASYSYNFITLAQIHEWLDDNGLSYEATTKRVEDREYMFITKIDKDGNKSEPMQAARIPLIETKNISVAEVMQDYGSVLAMARRYSLMMVYGLAPSDEDEQPLKMPQKPESGRYGAPAGHIDFNEVEFKLSQIDNVSQVDAFFEQLKAGGMSWRQKSSLESMFKKRKEQIKGQQ